MRLMTIRLPMMMEKQHPATSRPRSRADRSHQPIQSTCPEHNDRCWCCNVDDGGGCRGLVRVLASHQGQRPGPPQARAVVPHSGAGEQWQGQGGGRRARGRCGGDDGACQQQRQQQQQQEAGQEDGQVRGLCSIRECAWALLLLSGVTVCRYHFLLLCVHFLLTASRLLIRFACDAQPEGALALQMDPLGAPPPHNQRRLHKRSHAVDGQQHASRARHGYDDRGCAG